MTANQIGRNMSQKYREFTTLLSVELSNKTKSNSFHCT